MIRRCRAGFHVALLAMTLSAIVLFPDPTIADCGATERWFVKVGTDSNAGQVDIAHPIPSSVAELNALPNLRNQVAAGNNKFRLPEETKVYSVQGFLALFKNESDSDYHLVITDSSLTYTPGGPGTAGKETGTSFIAEIPSPDCTAGTVGDPTVHSVFENALHSARQKFEAKFPGGQGANQIVNLPVSVTGVAFYDRQHLQTGRAKNGIELHPILDISFDQNPTPSPQLTPQPAPQPVAGADVMTDGGFEAATDWGTSAPGWTSNSTDDDPAIIAGGSFPHSGENYAFLGGGNDLDVSLELSTMLPAGASKIQLSFSVNVVTTERSSAAAHDLLAVEIHDASGALLATPLTLSNRDAARSNNTPGQYCQPSPVDLTPFAGQTIKLSFHTITNSTKPTTFRIDDVAITAAP